MKAGILGTGTVPVEHRPFAPGSPRVSLSVQDSFSGQKKRSDSMKFPLHLEISGREIRRASSDSDLIRSQIDVPGEFSKLSGVGSRSFPSRTPEERHVSEDEVGVGGIGSLALDERRFDRMNFAGDWRRSGIPVEELGFPGGGGGRGGDEWRTGTSTGGNADRGKIGTYYQEMLKSDPMNPLLLRNYGRFLHEVEGDMVKAEECYGRAILASPGDGEVLSLYAKLIWETQRDEDRAQSYFDQAVQASPDDCTVLGSYAHFMWEAEDDEEEEEEKEIEIAAAHSMVVEAF